ncbi:PREDICTED: uncharacterized protein LOC104595996 [Nelumbo nucifera]|uniref:Uncharacterized protein LOC104595996 n=1 Tax=Nelumbo nucifera TaxID=4432 RepID=A0A1U7ZPH2_NELNU|nr:PREDICTED: uncharacterized protein LOC104595996 [Nelumbo nucifera]XP_010255263.1 PREDICTED: uncharacterized protein LOC104595996 [Nelumbo nucifera]XP_010255264.1 PREDICTED: uncharacterized protein LOC104595996 [Nelumbo nucifera]XP_010255265.1 PREDICTED: uncharacterized protein LOC104595996 [Nelumbo nucifera]
MICFCSCTGGQTSSLELNRRTGAASCNFCGGKQLVDGRKSESGSVLSTARLELKSVVDPDLTWKTVSKGNRSASRRARKPILRSSKGSTESIDKDIRVEDMPISESEKLGVTILGRRFSDKVEHVPIKKRRFLFRSPSPPPRPPSPCPDEPEQLVKSENAPGRESSCSSEVGKQVMEVGTADLGQVVDGEVIINGKTPEEINEKLGDSEDFSGISILAAAACNNNIGGSSTNAEEDSSMLEETSAWERPSQIVLNSALCLPKELHKDHSTNYCETSNKGTASQEITASLQTANSYNKESICGLKMGDSSTSDSSPISQGLPSNNIDGAQRKVGSSSRDDRSHWDLNTVMDAWEKPSDDHIVGSEENVVDSVFKDVRDCEKLENLESCDVQREPGSTKNDIEKMVQPMNGRVVAGVAGDNIYRLADSKNLPTGSVETTTEDLKQDGCFKTTCSEEMVMLSEMHNTQQESLVDLGEETKPSHFQESIGFISESVAAPSAKVLEFSSPNACRMDGCINISVCPEADHNTPALMPEKEKDTTSKASSGEQTGDELAADVQKRESLYLRTSQLEKHDVFLSDAVTTEKVNCEIDDSPTEDCVGAVKSLDLHDNGNASKKMKTDVKQLDDNTSKADTSLSSYNGEEFSSCSPPDGRSIPEVSADTKVQDGEDFVSDTKKGSSPDNVESEKLIPKSSGQSIVLEDTSDVLTSHEACKSYADDLVNNSGKISLEEDHFDDIDYYSDVSHDDPDHIVGMGNEIELQAGYDSQYEDGEVRESVLHAWDEDAGEEGETEHVDYGSDNRDAYGFDSWADYPVSISVEAEHGAECQNNESTADDSVDCSGEQVKEKTMQEPSSLPGMRGSSKTDILEAGTGKKGAVIAKKHLRGQSEQDDNCKFEMNAEVDKDLGASADKVMTDNDRCSRKGAMKEPMQSLSSRMKLSGWDQLPEDHEGSANMIMENIDGCSKKIPTSSRVNGLDAGESRRECPSRIEGLTSSDRLPRKDRICIQENRSNNLDHSNPRVERDPSPAKLTGRGGGLFHVHGRGRGGDRWVDSSAHWAHGRHRSPSFAHSGPKNAAAAAAAKVESSGFVVAPDGTVVKAGGLGPNVRVRRHSVIASSQGVHRSFIRRGSPSDREDAFCMHMRLGPVGDMSPDRNLTVGRGRSGRYGPRVVGTGLREKYHGSGPDDSSMCMQHSIVRRERSYSPVQRRESNHLSRSHTKSPSRSRTRSPHVWSSSPRGRNGGGVGSGPGLRERSRSPNFRSDARMVRGRSPHRRPGFSTQHEIGFMTTCRSRGSPQHSSRWIDDRKDTVDHFRDHGYKQRAPISERRSPGRIFPRSHRFDSVGSTGRLKPDEYYRPMHSGRFPEMVGAGRGPRYEENEDDRRKNVDRFGMLHPVRRYDTDGSVKRFHYDAEDGFAGHNLHSKVATEFNGRGSPKHYGRSIDARLGDAPRRSREEKSHFRYDRDWKYGANAKSFRIREFDEDVAPRRRIPS